MCVLRVTGFNSYLVDAVTYLLDAVTLTFILEALLWMA